jgi:hypothetical protein
LTVVAWERSGSIMSQGKISMRQKRRLNRSDRIAHNLLWVLVLLIMVGVVLALRTCHA